MTANFLARRAGPVPNAGRRPEGQPAVDSRGSQGKPESVLQCISASATGRVALLVSALGLAVSACQEPETPSKSGPPDLEQPLMCEETQPGSATLRLLTRTQYDNTLLDLLGDDTRPAQTFPPEHRVENFENNAETHKANPLLVERYWAAARDVSARAVADRIDFIAPCPDANSLVCVDAFLTSFGKRAFRRPMLPDEAASYRQLFEKAEPTLGYSAAVGLVLEALLQSPQFLYRVEATLPATPETGAIPLGDYELASRLSYFLWNSMPDEELFRAAEAHELSTPAQVEAQARRMLAEPKARAMVSDFHAQWLDMARFDGIARDDANLPDLDQQELADAWKESLLTYIDFVYWNSSGTLQELFTSDLIFVNPELAGIYGVAAPSDSFAAVAQPGQRAGLLTQPALMALLSHADQSSPIQRGVFVRAQILCDPPDPPPPTVNNNPPDPDPGLTTRERFAVHTANAVCAQCHQLIDPLGFGFENYDHFGRFRSDENQLPVDASGAVVESPDPSIDGPFATPFELVSRLGSSEAVLNCLTTHWYRFAMGRVETESDLCSLDQAKAKFVSTGGDLRELLVGLALTDAFLYRPAMTEGS